MGDWPVYSGQWAAMYGQSGSTSYMVAATAHANINTKGNWTQITAATESESIGIIIQLGYTETANCFLFDIGIGGAGSEVVLIADIARPVANMGLIGAFQVFIPVKIAKGSRLAFRCQCTTGAKYIRAGIILVAGGNSDNVGYTYVTTYGADTANTRGTSVDPGGSANAKGAYTQFSAAITRPAKALFLSIGNLNTARQFAEWFLDVAIGGAGSEQVLIPNLQFGCQVSGHDIIPSITPCIPISISAGTRIAIRAQCGITDATDRLIFPVVHLVG